jgi:hypothetical protein
VTEDDDEQEAVRAEFKRLEFFKNVNLTIFIFTFISGVFLIIDFLLYKEEYFQIPEKCFKNGNCNFDVRAPEKNGKQYIYFQFEGFYQNYRKYRDSIALTQFTDSNATLDDVQERCWGWATNKQMGKGSNVDGLPINGKKMALPCGLIAYSFPKSKGIFFLREF